MACRYVCRHDTPKKQGPKDTSMHRVSAGADHPPRRSSFVVVLRRRYVQRSLKQPIDSRGRKRDGSIEFRSDRSRRDNLWLRFDGSQALKIDRLRRRARSAWLEVNNRKAERDSETLKESERGLARRPHISSNGCFGQPRRAVHGGSIDGTILYLILARTPSIQERRARHEGGGVS